MKLSELLVEVRACRKCQSQLPCSPRPILAVATSAKVLIIGQAPGKRVHESGIAWDDPSGRRLREWLGVSREEFYDTSKFAFVPMAFCYPGKGPTGDLPPRPECAETWHADLVSRLTNVSLTLLIGKYAQQHYLGVDQKTNLTQTVRAWKDYWPSRLPLPHPSPRNNLWISKNPWFLDEPLPALRTRIRQLIG